MIFNLQFFSVDYVQNILVLNSQKINDFLDFSVTTHKNILLTRFINKLTLLILKKMALENFNLINSQIESFMNANSWVIYVILVVLIWKLVWYGLAIYSSFWKKQKAWFVALFVCAFVLNDLGLLAILYLVFNRDKKALKKKK